VNELDQRPAVPPLPQALLRRTPSLLLRRPVEADGSVLRALDRLPEMWRFRAPRPADQSVVRFERILRHWHAHGFGPWSFLLEGEVIGFGGLSHKAEVEGLNVGYQLHPRHWKKGYATELAREAVRFGFDVLGAARLVGLVHVDNLASARVLEKAGFSLQGERLYDGLPCRTYIIEPVR
jgi:ribosomal-protein-alanine N-acetyltransferase